MKKQNSIWIFLCGALLGVCLMLCIAAGEKAPVSTKRDFSHLQITGYPSGATGILDTETGMLYLYDVNTIDCFAVREITALGAPLRRVRN